MSRRRFDVAVIGGGPSGSWCARQLAAGGCSVALCQAGARRSTVELLSGRARWLLRDVALPQGVDVFETVSLWGVSEALSRNSIFDPYGPGLAIERADLDKALLDEAVSAGACLAGGRVRAVSRESGKWILGEELVADRIVLANGGTECRGIERQPKLINRQTAHFARFHAQPLPQLSVEKTERGWWYSLPAPRGGLFVGLCADGRVCFDDELARTKMISPQVEGPPGPRWGMAASVRSFDHAEGDRWIAVGNAAFTPDPLSGEGVWFALHTAHAAADVLLGKSTAEEYQSRIDQAAADHIATRETVLAAG